MVEQLNLELACSIFMVATIADVLGVGTTGRRGKGISVRDDIVANHPNLKMVF